MTPRTGRPTDNPKPTRMELRLSKSDVEMLNFCSEKLNVSKAEVIRRGIKEVYEKENNCN